MADNLYQKLLKITEEIGKIDKTGTNTTQNYKFIEQAKVVAEVRVQLAKYGVVIIPETVSRTIERYTTTKAGYGGKPAYEQASYHVNVVSRYTLVNADNPEDKMVCDWDAGEALDTSDKATNKATTASQKYFLMKLFNISDQDDPDGHSPEAPTPAKRPAKPTRDYSKLMDKLTPTLEAGYARLAETQEKNVAALAAQDKATPTQKARIRALLKGHGVPDEEMKGVLIGDYGVEPETMSAEDAELVLEQISMGGQS